MTASTLPARRPACSRILLPALFAALAAGAGLSAFAAPADSTDREHTRVLALPYALANSDDGLILGGGAGVSRPGVLYLVASAEFSFVGRMTAAIECELQRGTTRYVGRISGVRGTRESYPELAADPEPIATATEERVQVQVSALRQVARHWEIGPALLYESALGLDPEDADGNPLAVNTLPRYRPGTNALAGLRARRRTTSAVRPYHGSILDFVVQGGSAWSAAWAAPRADAAVQAFAALAKPFAPNLRLYLRADGRWQLNAPAPVRNFNGGERRVRGQPLRRELGRRIVFTRAQLHWTVLERIAWPMEFAGRILPLLPVFPLDVELVPFYDFGMIGDAEFGWRPARHGLGAGIRIVIPPELVLRIDVGVTPGGSPRFYLGVGETI